MSSEMESVCQTNEGKSIDNEFIGEVNESQNEDISTHEEDKDNDNDEDIDKDKEQDSPQNYFHLLYGDDFDNDNEVNEDDSHEEDDTQEEETVNCDVNEDTKVNIITNANSLSLPISESQKESNVKSNKRLSTEDNSSPAKRIKCEPNSPKSQSNNNNNCNEKRLTTTCEMIECTEDSTIAIPKNSHEFMGYLLDLDAKDLDSNNGSQTSMASHLKDVNHCLRFNDLETLCNTYIPAIITDLWEKVKRVYSLKHNINNRSKSTEKTTRYHSILTKSRSKRMKNGLELKCISFKKVNEKPVFRFGYLAVIRTAVQLKPNSNTHVITRKSVFGYITSHTIRECNHQNQSEVNHLRLLKDNKADSVLVEEVVFLTKYSDDLYLRNDALIVAEPIVCVHNYHLEARALFKFDQFLLWKQIFNPIFNTKPSGVLMNINESKLRVSEKQLECIQVALDVIANSNFSYSCFLAINEPKSLEKDLLIEIIKQIVRSDQFKRSKVLFTSSDDKCLNRVNERLKKLKINTFLIENNFSVHMIRSAIKHIRHKLTKDIVINDVKKKKLYEECLEYFEADMEHELSIETTLFKNGVCDQLRHDLLIQSHVIMGRIEDLCNDIAFYHFFSNNNNNVFNCCVIDDSDAISEPQLYSLLWFGIKKFILNGDLNDSKHSDDSNIRQRLGLSRSFFERYIELCPKGSPKGSTGLSVFDFHS